MLRYSRIVNELKKKDQYAITKLAIYYELSSANSTKIISNRKLNIIVNYLHNIYFSNDKMSYLYPRLVEAALHVCNYNLTELLSDIQEDKYELEYRILDEMDLL